MTFSRNWEIRRVFTKGHHPSSPREVFFVTTCRTLEMPSWQSNISKHDIIQHKQITTEEIICFFVYHKFGCDMEQKYIVYRNKQIYFGKVKGKNMYCRWVHASVTSIESCSSLEIFNASVTDLQVVTQICHAQHYLKYNLN